MISMKYLGNKTRLINFIEKSLQKNNITYEDVTVLDLCAGTGSVSLFFKQKNCSVSAVDIMNYSVGEMYRTLYFNNEPLFNELENCIGTNSLSGVLQYLNNLEPIEGYYYEEYGDGGRSGRKYFTDANSKKIDAIMLCLNDWKNILPVEKYLFLNGIVVNAIDRVANVAGTYGSFLKIWRSMALKPLVLTKPSFIDVGNVQIFKEDINKFLSCNDGHIFYDIVYLDPPYNERQYAPNFHVLENISNNNLPVLYGKTGLIKYEHQKSLFCYKKKAIQYLEEVVSKINCNCFLLSYSTEGIMKYDEILILLEKYFIDVVVEKVEYRRFKTNSNTNLNTGLCELLFVCNKKKK